MQRCAMPWRMGYPRIETESHKESLINGCSLDLANPYASDYVST